MRVGHALLRPCSLNCPGLLHSTASQPAARCRSADQQPHPLPTPTSTLLQRWDAARLAAALGHWRQLLAERCQAQEDLKRCLIRKRVAFRLYRQWYWESFDDDMQVGGGVGANREARHRGGWEGGWMGGLLE